MVLLQRFFYVMIEIANGLNKLHFYLKCVYQRMRDTEIHKMQKDKILKRVHISVVTRLEHDHPYLFNKVMRLVLSPVFIPITLQLNIISFKVITLGSHIVLETFLPFLIAVLELR